MLNNTTGSNNTAIGYSSLSQNRTASSNVAVGTNALISSTYSSQNTAVGKDTLYTQSYANGNSAWATENVAVGFQALYYNQPTGSNNVSMNIFRTSYQSTIFSLRKGSFLLLIVLCLSFCTKSSLFSQTTLKISNGAFMKMNGGSAASPIYLVIGNANTNAVTRSVSGHIISENEYNKLKWQIGTGTGTYTFPFGKDNSNYIPLEINVTSAGTCPAAPCSYAASIWYTLNNAILPATVTNVNPSENSSIDRFWVTSLSGYTANPTSTIRFYYLSSELDGITEADLCSQRWNGAGWNSAQGTANTGSDYVEVVGANAYSQWTLTNVNVPLPIELIAFDAIWADENQRSSIVRWSTATENNNDYFTIERSLNGLDFDSLTTIDGVGFSQQNQNYSFADQLEGFPIDSAFIYYRLKQVDIDGAFKFSQIILLARSNHTTSLLLYPIPTSSIPNINYMSDNDQVGEITIENSLSQVLLSQYYPFKKGQNSFIADVSELAVGVYHFKIVLGKNSVCKKFVVNKL